MLLFALLFLLSLPQVILACGTCSQNPALFSFSLGSIPALVVQDGTINNPISQYGALDAAVQRSYSASFRPSFPFRLSTNPIILEMPYGRVLIETGAIGALELPAFAETGKLITNMRAAGIEPSTIRYILLTHAHVGHGTGLVDESGTKLYPNAKVFISQIDHEFWFASPPQLNGTDFPPEQQDLFDTFASLYRKNIIPYLDDLVFLHDNDEPLEGIKVLHTPGHSPGHVVFNVTSNAQSMLVIGDVWFTKPDQVQNPDWTFELDTDRRIAYESRIRVLDLAVKEQSLVLAFHEAFPGVGYIKNDGAFFDWEPMVGENLGVGIGLKCITKKMSSDM
eukprot:TRINITY_DN1402_c0_g1_i1.p1 TRINITY_DN1402_c0_g1~~TRINITY_DN1402_c0_g1_i1.p1  ORF type:complete len:336 (+),score=51.94 TRINITY_DN1402_c0_g1_i1:297-1304(+)